MINVTVIDMKTIMKYLVGISILVIGISCTRFFYDKQKTNISIKLADINLVECLDTTLPDIKGNSSIKRFETEVSTRDSGLKRMLGVELPMMNNLLIDGEENENIKPKGNETIEEKIETAKTDVTTKTIEENNITPKYNLTFGSVKVKNESDKEITEETLMPNISLENNKDIIIFHTHTCESYTPSEQFNYEMTGSYRTTDLNYTVSRVGDELEKHLSSYGYNVIHDKTYHDYPAYSGSYGRSLTTVQNILQNGSNAQMVIDLHRDAVRK